jgi:hypothetical protein
MQVHPPFADEILKQCAVMAWILSDVYSRVALEKLTQPARTYLLQLCCLGLNPRGAAAQAARLQAHLASRLLDRNGGDSDVGGGKGGATRSSCADSTLLAESRRRLLSPLQLAALLAIPRGEIRKLLDAAGVPHGAGSIDMGSREASHGG